jgi:hypothetical protein
MKMTMKINLMKKKKAVMIMMTVVLMVLVVVNFKLELLQGEKYFLFFLLDDSPASEFYMSTFRNTLFHLHKRCAAYTTYLDGTECSKTSTYEIQTPGNHPKDGIQHSDQGESLK